MLEMADFRVPPASRGNRVSARRGSPRFAGGDAGGGAIVNSAQAVGIVRVFAVRFKH